MTPDEFQQAWQADAARTRVTIDAESLSREAQRSHEEFRSMIYWRDLREVAVGLTMLPLWLFMGATLSLPWTWYLTVPALIWVVGFFLVDRRLHPQRPSEPGEPLLFYMKESLAQVEHQIWLLRNVFWWYLLPFSISIMAFFLQVAWQSSGGAWWAFAVVSLLSGLFLFVIYGWVYRLNQTAVRTQLEPRRRDLSKLIASLEGEATGEGSAELAELADLVSALDGPVSNCGLSSSWAQNWDRLIPSWGVATAIALAALGGALPGLWLPIPKMGTFFPSVAGAVVAFEIALGIAWMRSRKKRGEPLPSGGEVEAATAGAEAGRPANEAAPRLPRAPAMAILVLTLFVSLLAVVALVRFMGDSRRIKDDAPPTAGLQDVSAFDDDDILRTDAWLRNFVDGSVRYPSLSAAVVRDGEIVYRGAFGFEDVEAYRKATPQTQYHVASVTKAFTATLAVILHDRGVVDLDRRVVEYLPEGVTVSTAPELGATITLRQLASHTSGLPRGVPGPVQSVELYYQLEPQRLYDHLADVKLTSDPGTQEEYSNLGFGLLGHALERAAGKPLDRLLQETVCEPLQLNRTAITSDDTLRPATGYERVGSRFEGRHVERRESFQERLAASGGLVTSVEDLAKFLAAQMKPGTLSERVLKQLHTESKLANGSAAGTALGWSVTRNDSVGRVLEKNGGRSNCSAWIGFAPEHRVGVVIVTNCGGPDVDPIGRQLLERSIPLARRPASK